MKIQRKIAILIFESLRTEICRRCKNIIAESKELIRISRDSHELPDVI